MSALIGILLQGLLVAIVIACTFALIVAAVRYVLAEPKNRVLIAPAPERGNIIPFHSARLNAKGLKLSVPAVNPSRGGQ
jgi:hypothetical protein